VKKIKLPYLREVTRFGQGLIQDGRVVGYTYLRWTFNLYLKHRCYRSWIRFEKQQGQYVAR
jgi:hypothetical protein